MGYPIAKDIPSSWKPPKRVFSLEDYICKPKQKSKLSKELREYEEADVKDEVNDLLFGNLPTFTLTRIPGALSSVG